MNMDNNDKTVELAKEFLVSQNAGAKAELAGYLETFTGDFDAIVSQLRPKVPEKAATGLLEQIPFSDETFQARYPWSRMTCMIPEDYNPKHSYGLLIFLHGGGKGMGNTSPQNYCTPESGLIDIFQSCGRIVCLPSAPPSMKSFSRWHLPETDDYIASVIDEMAGKYNIDPNNILLSGHSMGGQGVNHLAHRMSDRFGSVFSSCSSWDIAYWPCLMGTVYWAVQGRNDTTMFLRRHGTDIEFMNIAHQRLNQAGVTNFCRESQGRHHGAHSRMVLKEWLRWCEKENIRRDPYHHHVIAVTPRGLTPWIDFKRHKTPLVATQNHIDFHEIADSPHCRWVTIDEQGTETIMYDMADMSDCKDDVEQDWNQFRLNLKRKHINGGLIEAFIDGRNLIEVTPVNVKKFTLWLHPDMIDFSNLRVMVQGVEMFSGKIAPSLVTLLESYQRRRDWGMLYSAKLTFEDKDGKWAQDDQLKVKV
jgi:hypothetical protein